MCSFGFILFGRKLSGFHIRVCLSVTTKIWLPFYCKPKLFRLLFHTSLQIKCRFSKASITIIFSLCKLIINKSIFVLTRTDFKTSATYHKWQLELVTPWLHSKFVTTQWLYLHHSWFRSHERALYHLNPVAKVLK